MLDADFKHIFQSSFDRAVREDIDGFYTVFYERFIESSPGIREAFRNTNMHRQREMMHESLLSMVSFAQNFKASRYLTKIGRLHGASGLNLDKGFFSHWLEALIKTVAEKDPAYGPQVDLAWRIMMAPGVAYMVNVDRLLVL